MKGRITLFTVLALALSATQVARADCAERIDELRETQSRTQYLDASRPDLERLRQVAQKMAERGKEELCLELVRELEAIVKEHREHVESLDILEKYAIPVPVGSYGKELHSSHLIGMSIRNLLGKELGVVDGLLISSQGKVQAVIIEHGGFMGIGEKRVKLNWNQLQLTADGSAVVLDMTPDEVKTLPEVKQ